MPFVGTPKNINEIEKENTYRPTKQLKPFMETEILVYIWFPLNAAFIDWKSARAFSCAVSAPPNVSILPIVLWYGRSFFESKAEFHLC